MKIGTVLSAFFLTCRAGLTDPFAGQQDVFYSNITEDPAYQANFSQQQQTTLPADELQPKPLVLTFNEKIMQIAPSTFKICILLALLTSTFVGLIVKPCIKRWRGLESPFNSFACGSYLSIAMLQMLPQSDSLYNSWASTRHELLIQLEIPHLLLCLGYFLILFADKVAICKELKGEKELAEEREMTT